LRLKYGYIAYPDDLFYKTHKITVKDLLDKVDASSEPKELLNKLFDDASHSTGRRGVLNMKKSVELVKRKLRNKDKMRSFAKKFTDEGLTNQELKSTGFMRSDMLY
jgi:hypothetical protein